MTIRQQPPRFERILNFRDVSSLLSKPSKLKAGILFRSARPDEASPADQALLTETYNIHTIVDLRSATEHLEQARRLAVRTASTERTSTASSPWTAFGSNAAAGLPRISGIVYRQVNFNGGAYIRSMLSRLSWRSYLAVLAYYVVGYRVEAAQIIGHEVMRPRGVVGLMLDSLDVCTKEVAMIFNEVLANDKSYPVMLHCTQGKDRTGLIVMLTLFLLGLDLEDVQRDYMATQRELESEREERVNEIARIGLGPEWADCDHTLVAKVKTSLDVNYGGIEPYLVKAGVSRETQEKVRNIMCQ